MKKLLVGVISLALLLSSCTPSDVELADRCLSSTVLIHMKIAKGNKKGMGTCSGVYVSPHLILTADHCVDMSMEGIKGLYLKELWVKNINDESALATIIKVDPRRDLALLRTDLKGTPVKLAWDVKVGEEVWVVGNPLGLQFIVSKGIVSRTDVTTDSFPIEHFVTDAVVLPGNSGGPCYNSHGNLIGIVVMSTSMFGMMGASGLGFVVQINEVRTFLRHVKAS
jgi:S1-C subfamily serine protease